MKTLAASDAVAVLEKNNWSETGGGDDCTLYGPEGVSNQSVLLFDDGHWEFYDTTKAINGPVREGRTARYLLITLHKFATK